MKTPYWVFLIVAVLASVPPLTHAWLRYAPPEGTVATGLITGDSGHHRVAMRAMADDFTSPFVTCQADAGEPDLRYYLPPLFLLYAVVGELGRMLGLDAFLWLGLINGLGGALYLWCVWRFLRCATPALARRGFLLFTLAGGLGGVLYLLARALGYTETPGFEQLFQRFAWYELIEGQHLRPDLLFHRLYYTLALAAGYAALTALVESAEAGCPRHRWFMNFLACCAALLNVRLALPFLLIAGLYLGLGSAATRRMRTVVAVHFVVANVLGGTLGYLLVQAAPAFAANVAAITQDAMRLLPFLYQAGPMLVLAMLALADVRPANRFLRAALGALYGYAIAYTLLYVGYQLYQGNYRYGGESRATAIFVSGWALCGVLPGALLCGWRQRAAADAPKAALPLWVAFWLLLLLVAAPSAWGQGLWLHLAPQRFMILLGPALALAAAAGLERLRPKVARALCAGVVALGITSSAIAALYFQGPWGGPPGRGPFAYLRYALMTKADANGLPELPAGTYLVPGWNPIAFGEILAQYPGLRPLGGPGAMNLGDQPLSVIQHDVDAFFTAGCPDAERTAIVERWCVDGIYCADSSQITLAQRVDLRRWARRHRYTFQEVGLSMQILLLPAS